MLRLAVLGAALLMLLAGAVAALTGSGGAWPLTIWGALLAVAVLFERWRYQKPPPGAEHGNWQKTGEQFIDPESGQPMEVLYDPASGERRYVAAKGQNN